MNSFVTNVERDVYLNHIRRLEEDNRLLASVIAQERRLRIYAWKTHWYWCRHTIWNLLRAMIMMVNKEDRARSYFFSEADREAA